MLQVIAIAMDIFTDVDIFKEVVDASVRAVPVYILLDHIHFKSFLTMIEKQDVQIQQLRVSVQYFCHLTAKITVHTPPHLCTDISFSVARTLTTLDKWYI